MTTKKTNHTGSSPTVKKYDRVSYPNSGIVGTSSSTIKRCIGSITTTSDFEQALKDTQLEYAQIIKDLEDK
ncbi:hypothetical protein [Providencia sp. PROV040]|uniref:hypothetical protein n=1 Tax=Providencia sp. PROV040 TaxID=2949771 RepID=UPI0029343D6E|nr:hypothetical protein [Providencia sp. PROV040]WOB87391.1 hypothetical protein P3L40_05750 [Providencia sp. PROV040]